MSDKLTFDSILVSFGAVAVSASTIYPKGYGQRILATLTDKVARVVVPLPVEGWTDTGMIDKLRTLEGVEVIDASGIDRATFGNLKSNVNNAADRVSRKVIVQAIRNAAGDTIAASITNAAS
jgi:hypothetical protein